MTKKNLFRAAWILGLAIAVTLTASAVLSEKNIASSDKKSEVSDSKASAEQSPSHKKNKVVAYYFHTNARCSTCMKIEAYSKAAIEEGFATELRNGSLELRVVNYEKPENRHYIKEYKLVTKSLILVRMDGGKQAEWTNLKLVWQLTGNKEAFVNYVRGEVGNCLAKI